MERRILATSQGAHKYRRRAAALADGPAPTLGSPLVSPGSGGPEGRADRRQRRARQPSLTLASAGRSVEFPHERFETRRRAWRPAMGRGKDTSAMNWRGLDERHSGKGRVLTKADRALKLHEQGLTRAQIAERLCVKPDSVKGMLDRAKQRRAKMSMAARSCGPEPAVIPRAAELLDPLTSR